MYGIDSIMLCHDYVNDTFFNMYVYTYLDLLLYINGLGLIRQLGINHPQLNLPLSDLRLKIQKRVLISKSNMRRLQAFQNEALRVIYY